MTWLADPKRKGGGSARRGHSAGTARAQRPFLSEAWQATTHHSGSIRPQGKGSTFRQQSGIFSVKRRFIGVFGPSKNLQPCAWEHTSHCGHLGHRGEWVQNSLTFRTAHGAAPRGQGQPRSAGLAEASKLYRLHRRVQKSQEQRRCVWGGGGMTVGRPALWLSCIGRRIGRRSEGGMHPLSTAAVERRLSVSRAASVPQGMLLDGVRARGLARSLYPQNWIHAAGCGVGVQKLGEQRRVMP